MALPVALEAWQPHSTLLAQSDVSGIFQRLSSTEMLSTSKTSECLPFRDSYAPSPSRADFAVLLNGRTSQTPMTTSRVATGRLSLRRKTLHFSFLLEEGYPTPASIQFLSEDGNILEQLEAQPTPYEATNNRVCGTWTRVPREYR